MPKNTKQKVTFIDLFAGIGGFHIAFHNCGAECVFVSEWDKSARETYQANFKTISPNIFKEESRLFAGDITKVDAKDIPDFDILTGGFPCQPFSQAGLKKGFHETRGTLFFDVDGIILVGNRHEYRPENSSDEIIDYFVKQGYNKEGLNKDFYLGEWIEFYIDTKYSGSSNDVKILVTPHKTVEELEKLSLTKLEELANENDGFVLDYKTPEADNHKYVGEGYVTIDDNEGKYDILFTYKGKLAYFINVNLTKEPTE